MTVDGARFREGSGRLCLDFVRTLRHRGMADEEEGLPDAEALIAWVRQCGPCGAAETGKTEAADTADPVEGRAVREAVYALVTAALRGEALPRGARLRVNEMAGTPVPVPALDTAGRLRWSAADPVRATLALIARDALDLVASGSLARVRECSDDDCGALFVDSSRPGTRRWCSMGTCGNRAKKATLRQKAERG